MFCASILSNVFAYIAMAPLVIGFIWCVKCIFIESDGVKGAEILFCSLIVNLVWGALLLGLKKLFM